MIVDDIDDDDDDNGNNDNLPNDTNNDVTNISCLSHITVWYKMCIFKGDITIL